MSFETKSTSGVATRAEGALAHCGPWSSGFELSYSCQGPACSSLDGSFQNVVCHRDGSSRLICSNDVKCRPGTSTYQSNFTFSQNEADPWSPTMENQPDTWIPQDQHVMVGGCARFSLTSDGTREGTNVFNATNNCRNLQHSSTPGAMVGQITTSSGRAGVSTTQEPLGFAGKSSRSNVFKSSFFLTLIFAFIVLLPEAHASIDHQIHKETRRTNELQTKSSSDGPQAFAAGLRAELAEKANNQGVDGKAFANDLVAGVVSSVCQGTFEGSSNRAFEPEILEDCIASVYSGEQLPQPALRFLAVFGCSILCNYIVGGTYPSGQASVPESCNELQNLMEEMRTDATIAITPASTAVGSSTYNAGSSGVYSPVLSFSNTQDLTRLSPFLSLQESSSPKTPSSKTSKPDTASGIVYSPSASSSSRSTPSAFLDNVTAGGAPSDAFSSIELPASALAAVDSSFFPSARPLSEQESLVRSTERAGTLALFATSSRLSSAFTAPSVINILGTESITSRLGDGSPLAVPKLSQSSHDLWPQKDTSKSSTRSYLLRPGQSSRMEPSLSKQGDITGSFGSVQTILSPQEDVSNASIQSGMSRSLSLDKSPGVAPSAPIHGEMSASSKPAHTITASLPTTAVSDVSLALSLTSPSTVAPDRSSVESPATQTTRYISMPSNLPFSSAILLEALTSRVLSLTAGTAEYQRTGVLTSDDLLTALRSSSAAGVSTDEQTVASFFTGSTTVAFASKDQLLNPQPSAKLVPSLVALVTAMFLGAPPADYSPSGEPLSFTPADRSADTWTIGDYSLASSGSEVFDTIDAKPKTSTVIIPVIPASLTASAVVPSSTLVAASNSSLALLTPFSNPSPTAATESPGFSTRIVDPGSESWPIPSTFAVSSIMIILPAAVLSKTFIMSTASPNSASERSSRSSDPSADLAFSASAISISESSSSPGSLMPQDEPTAPFTSALPTIAPTLSNSVSPSDQMVISSITSSSSQAIVAASSLANMGVPFKLPNSGNFGSSSSKSTATAAVSSNLIPSANVASPPSNGSTAPIVFASSPIEGSLATTPPVDKVYSTLDSSPAIFESSPVSTLASSCSQNSSAPNFCPGIGCVSFMISEAHCGACSQVCIYECRQGTCVCPDLTSPNETNKCDNRPILVDCESGYYTRNGFRVCVPAGWPSISSTSTPASNRASAIRSAVLSISSPTPTGFPLRSAAVVSIETSDSEPLGCPPSLPDVCDGVCFNTKGEHNHCGGCGSFCSGTCIAGSCLTTSTESPTQLISTGRMVVTSGPPIVTPARQTSTSTIQPVVAYIWRGLAGPQQA